MLKIVLSTEYFDDEKQEFEERDVFVLELEHSLLSLSKWESRYKKPFLSSGEKTDEELSYYIEAMIVSPDYPSDFRKRLSNRNVAQINEYIESTESATNFGEMPKMKGRGETITSELIYYWLVAFQIPFEVEYWHLNRLFSLIRICNIKNSKPRKLSKAELSKQYHEINEKRKAELGTRG